MKYVQHYFAHHRTFQALLCILQKFLLYDGIMFPLTCAVYLLLIGCVRGMSWWPIQSPNMDKNECKAKKRKIKSISSILDLKEGK